MRLDLLPSRFIIAVDSPAANPSTCRPALARSLASHLAYHPERRATMTFVAIFFPEDPVSCVSRISRAFCSPRWLTDKPRLNLHHRLQPPPRRRKAPQCRPTKLPKCRLDPMMWC